MRCNFIRKTNLENTTEKQKHFQFKRFLVVIIPDKIISLQPFIFFRVKSFFNPK